MVKFVHKYTDRNIPSVYTNKITNNITMEFKKGKSYGDVTLFTERMTKGMSDWMILLVNPSIIFNLWPSLPPFLLLPYAFFYANSHPLLISTQFNFTQQIWPPQHSVCQHLYSDSNFIEDSPP
jgi:hypothetical protein